MKKNLVFFLLLGFTAIGQRPTEHNFGAEGDCYYCPTAQMTHGIGDSIFPQLAVGGVFYQLGGYLHFPIEDSIVTINPNRDVGPQSFRTMMRRHDTLTIIVHYSWAHTGEARFFSGDTTAYTLLDSIKTNESYPPYNVFNKIYYHLAIHENTSVSVLGNIYSYNPNWHVPILTANIDVYDEYPYPDTLSEPQTLTTHPALYLSREGLVVESPEGVPYELIFHNEIGEVERTLHFTSKTVVPLSEVGSGLNLVRYWSATESKTLKVMVVE